ncbi:hypothetical protein EVAR_35536_1 [Eumeta japonica]|uniref:Uncharacterized protein n=1 Tax=Eumeta variegata TaxID=151549 RepID=A0A4C1X948_EUMVA|nr:hypothetical protein EVAR_35536_1 [Eumeta japonica]
MEEHEALLASLDDSKPEHETVLTKVNADFLIILELSDSIKLSLCDLYAEGNWNGFELDHLCRRPTQFSKRDQEWLSHIKMLNNSLFADCYHGQSKICVFLVLSFIETSSFDQLIKFLEEEFRLLDNIPRDVRISSDNVDRWVTPDQRVRGSDRTIKTPPLLQQESNSKRHPADAVERNQK